MCAEGEKRKNDDEGGGRAVVMESGKFSGIFTPPHLEFRTL